MAAPTTTTTTELQQPSQATPNKVFCNTLQIIVLIMKSSLQMYLITYTWRGSGS
jgi:hypothetical protein